MQKVLNSSENIPNYVEIFIDTPIDELINRDPKGLYAREKRGEINTLVGASSPYNEPECPDIILDTEGSTPEESHQELISKLTEMQINI